MAPTLRAVQPRNGAGVAPKGAGPGPTAGGADSNSTAGGAGPSPTVGGAGSTGAEPVASCLGGGLVMAGTCYLRVRAGQAAGGGPAGRTWLPAEPPDRPVHAGRPGSSAPTAKERMFPLPT